MAVEKDFPAEFPSDPEEGPAALRWTIAVLALTALALSVLNPEAITNWAAELPANPGMGNVMATADSWNARVAEVRLDVPRKDMHGVWKRAEAMRWPHNAPSSDRGTAQSD